MGKKILVLFAGGVMGSTVTESGISIVGDGRYELISLYRRMFGSDISFECRRIFDVSGENIMPFHWQRITEVLSNVDTSAYMGIIITHATDTLAYTSALLGMYYRHVNIPVCIVSSNKPVGDKGSNGIFNFAGAVDMIKKSAYSGVFTVYEKVYISTRLLPADSCRDIFRAYGEDNVNENSVYRSINKRWLTIPREQVFHGGMRFERTILFITCYPAMDFSAYSLDSRPSAVLLAPYHRGTVCTDDSFGERFSVIGFVRRCLLEDIRVYLCGKKTPDAPAVKKLLGAGCIPMGNISAPAAYAKLMLCYNSTDLPVRELLKKNLFFERVGERCSE